MTSSRLMNGPSTAFADKSGIEAALDKMAAQIAARPSCEPLALVGLLSRGDIVARRLAARLEALGQKALCGAIDISLYRDDMFKLENRPALRSSDLPFSTDDMRLVLIDDVLYTGRTIRAALEAVFDYGRPSRVELACLIDRGGRELPIQADYVGFTVPDSSRSVRLSLEETDGCDQVIIC